MDDDELFDSVLGPRDGTATATKPAPISEDDELFDSVTGRPENKPVNANNASVGTPENPLAAVITFSQKLADAHELGQAGFREAALGHAVRGGRMTLEEAEAQIEADTRMAQLSGDLDAYEKESWNSWITGIPTSIGLSTAKQLPMLEESLNPLAAGFGVGGGAALATGAGAPLAVPVGAMTGTAAAAGWAADLISGQEYLDMRRRGLSHETASFAAPISGVLQGIFSGLMVGNVAKIPLKSATAQQVLREHIAETVKFFASQEALAELGTITSDLTKAIAGYVSKTPQAIPTLEEAVKDFLTTFKETGFGSAGIFIGGKTAGGLAGAFRRIHDKHLGKQKAKLEKIKQAEEAANQAEQEPAESEADTAESGPSKTKQNRDRIAAERLAKRMAAEAEVNRIFEAVNSIFYSETPETRIAEARRIQRLLKRMVTNSDKLDDAMKTRLLSRVIEINSVDGLLKEGQKFIDDQRGREYANDLAAAETRLEKAISSGQPKKNKAVMAGSSAQASLQWYKEFFTAPEIPAEKGVRRQAGEAEAQSRAAALKKATDFIDKGILDETKALEQQLEKLEKNELSEIFNQPADLLEKRRVAMEAQQFWSGSMDPAKIEALAGQIEEMVSSGKAAFLEKKRAESQRLLSDRQKIHDGVNGIKPVVPSVADTAPKQLNDAGRLMHSLRRNSTALWDKLLQDTPVGDREKLQREILDFTDVENKEFAINQAAVEKMSELFNEAAGSVREFSKLVRKGARSEKFNAAYTDAAGNSQIIGRHTLNELVYLHMAFQDEGAVAGLVAGNKYTLEGMVEAGQTSTQEAVRQILAEREGGKYLKLADAIKDFYRWFAPQIANHYLKEYGVSLPMHENYSGQIYHRQLERIRSAADLLNDVHNYATSTLNPGSVKLRQNSKLPVKLVDPFAQVQRHRLQMAFWIANSDKARALSFIFSDTSKDGLRDVIEHKLGKEFTSLIDGRLAWQFHLKPGIMDIGDRVAQNVKNNLATGLLGARFDQAPKQWTSVLGALSTNTFPEFLDGLRKATDKKQLQEYLSRSEVYRDRQNELLPQILEATKEQSYLDAVSGDRMLALKSFFLIPMSNWGDGVASAVTGFVEFNRVRKNGGSIEEAVLAGDNLVDRSQSSSRQSQKVPAEFKGGISNLSLAFAKQNIQMLNLESGAIRDWWIHKDDKHLARAARTIFAIHTAQALFQAINSVPAWVVGDQKEQGESILRVLSAAVGGSFSAIPLLGVDVVYGALSGWKGQQTPKTIIGGIVGDSTKLVKRVWTIAAKLSQGEEVNGEDWTKAFQSTASVASVATGIPFWGLWKYTDLGSRLVKKAAGENE